MSKREFQYCEGKSQKFWSITREGCTHTVNYGRLGTAGQTQTKEFATEDEAKKSCEKLIGEKLKKGYVEVAVESASPSQDAEVATKSEQSETKTQKPAIPATATDTEPPEPAIAQGVEQKAIARQAVPRSLDLDPDDWLWATWRERTPRKRPEPTPFNQKEALKRLSKIPDSYTWNWNCAKAQIAVSLSREEAHFWFTVMVEVNHHHHRNPGVKLKPKELALQLAERSFSGELSLEQVKEAIAIPEFILPLVNLFPVADLMDCLLNRNINIIGSPQEKLILGFHSYALPYLTEAEIELLRQRLRPELNPANWPINYHAKPPAAFHLAAQLKLHDELRLLVESWPDDFYGGQYTLDYCHRPQDIIFGLGDPRLVETHMRRLKLRLKNPSHIRVWLAHTEYAALDYICERILAAENKEDAEAILKVFKLVKAPEAAPYMLELKRASKTPQIARQWLDENLEHSVAGLIPVAARRGRLADAAIEWLRLMMRRGHEDLIRTYIELNKANADKVRSEVLEHPEKDYVPFDDATTPEWLRTAVADAQKLENTKPFNWVAPIDLPPIVVGELCLSEDQVAALLHALQQSQFDRPHPLVTQLKNQAKRESLDVFAWCLFEFWLSEGAPAKDKWALMAVGLLGSDTSALKLAPLIRVWPGENQHQRAVLGLQCLQAIGTDTALMQINGIAQKLKFKALKAEAQNCIERIAQSQGLSREQLEDRIVPDSDLDEKGSRVFDFGSRQFRFVLGLEMKPMLKDEAGKLKKDLPKPGAKDDADKATLAIADWKLLKKQIAEVVKIQAVRLEQVMVSGRRWSYDEFENLLVRHPLMTNLVRLLIWGGYNCEGQLIRTFRVTEDKNYANADDETIELEGIAEVGIIHPLHLLQTERSLWGELFSDYEIVPPFPQLGRTLYSLNPEETTAKEITRFKDIKIPAISLTGTLEKLGWVRSALCDHGCFYEHLKPFYSANVTAVVGEYDGGIPTGMIGDWDYPAITQCFFIPGIHTADSFGHPIHWYTLWHPLERMPLSEVDPVLISEVISDLSAVAAKGK